MNFSTVLITVCLPIACIAVAAALMRLFDVKDATPEQSKAEAERLLAHVPQAVTTRRVRAGAPSDVLSTRSLHFNALRTTRLRFPSA